MLINLDCIAADIIAELGLLCHRYCRITWIIMPPILPHNLDYYAADIAA